MLRELDMCMTLAQACVSNAQRVSYSKTCVKQNSQKDKKLVYRINYRLMQVKSFAECSNSAILSTFIKLPFVIKIIVLSNFEWPFYTGFTVFVYS